MAVGPRRLLLRHLTLHALRLRPLTLGHPDLQDPILIGRLRQIALDLTGQGQRADEGAVAQLAPDIVAAPLLMLRLSLALERECIVCHRDVDVLGIDAGQLRADNDVAVGLKQLDRRLPCRQRLPARAAGGGRPQPPGRSRRRGRRGAQRRPPRSPHRPRPPRAPRFPPPHTTPFCPPPPTPPPISITTPP